MADLVTKLRLDNSEFNSSIDSAKQKTKEFQRQADDTKKTLNEMGQRGGKSVNELLQEMNKLNNTQGHTNFRRELKQIQNDLNSLTITYRQMSDEMKNSPVGRDVLNTINELTVKAAEYKDAINDVQEEIQRMSSDTAVWDGLKQGINTVSASLQAFAAAGFLSADSSEKLLKVLAKVKAIEVASNAVIKIGNALQRNSALMAGISTIQHKALARAKDLETQSTVRATIAQKALNKVANANPYILLASAIIALGTALYFYTQHTEKARIEQEKENELVKKAEEDFNSYKNTVSDAVGTVEGKFRILQKSYLGLRTEMERNEFIKENADEFNKLGINIQNTNDANKIFIEQAEDVINALKAKARAAALASLYQEQYTKQVEAEIQAEKLLADARKKEIERKPKTPWQPQDWKNAGLNAKEGDYVVKEHQTIGQGGASMSTPSYELTPQGEEKMRKYYEELARQAGQEIIDSAKTDISTLEKLWEDAELSAAQAANKVRGLLTTGKGGEKKKEEEIFDPSSLKAAQQQVQALRNQLEGMSPDDENFEHVLTQLRTWETIQKNLTELIKETDEKVEEMFDPASLKYAQQQIKILQEQLEKMSPDDENFEKILTELHKWEDVQKHIVELMQQTEEQSKTTLDVFKEIQAKARDIDMNLSIGGIDKATAEEEVKNLNKQLEAMGLTVRFKVGIDGKSVEQLNTSINEALSGMVSQTDKVVGGFNAVYKSVSDLDKKLDDAKNGWEAFIILFENGITIIDAVTQTIQALSTVSELLTAATAAMTAAKTKNTAATTAEAAAAAADASAQTTDTTATITNAAAHGAAAATKAGESAAAVPIAGAVLAPIAIVAVLAAVLAAIGALSKFAEGGVVGGSSHYGDKILARVNSGELILNEKQQGKLWGMMNTPAQSNTNNVRFVIEGEHLVGVINNYQKHQSRV